MRGRPRAATGDSATTRYRGADGRWHARVTVGRRLDGEREHRRLSRATMGELDAAVRELENVRDSGARDGVTSDALLWNLADWRGPSRRFSACAVSHRGTRIDDVGKAGTPVGVHMEPLKSRVRRIRVHFLFWRTLALPFLMVVVSCSPNDTTGVTPTSPEPSEPAAAHADAEPPKGLTCPGGGIFGTDGGLLPAGAKLGGTDTAGEAVEKWMSSRGGADYVLTDDASGAWVLRADGTARAKANLLLSDGWVVHGYEACW